MLTVTVSQLNRYLKALADENPKLRDVYVKGEITNFRRHFASGHCYFALREADSAIPAVLFRGHAELLAFEPQDGMAVLARAAVGVYERTGSHQLYVTELVPHGAGAQAIALEQLRERLRRDGLFDLRHKQPLPPFPQTVGVVTSRSGAALHDILTVLERRWPLCSVLLAPALVQGEGAAASLCAALEGLDGSGRCDVILLARGGGSAEDLSCFHDEGLVRCIHACKTPVISAVGHETDVTLCDLAADMRAPTPSAAAELAVPDRAELLGYVCRSRQRLAELAGALLGRYRAALSRRAAHPALRTPAAYLNIASRQLERRREMLALKSGTWLRDLEHGLRSRASLLDSLSPLRVLDRGYTLTYRDGELITCAGKLRSGDEIRVRFRDGTARAAVRAVAQGKEEMQ